MVTLVVTPVGTGGTTRRRHRRLLADELGFWLETTISATAIAGEATRVLLADELRDDEQGWMWPDQMWAYARARGDEPIDTQRRVISQPEVGYRGADAMLLLSRPLDEALAVGDAIEVTSPLPCKRVGHVKGLNDCVDEGLARCPAVATLTLTGLDSDRLSLDDYPFITHEDQILGIYDRFGVLTTNAARPSGLPFRIDANATTRYLVFGRQYTSSETFEIQVTLPGDRLVYDGAAWGFPTETPGLLADDYRSAVPERWVLAFGMVAALRFLERLTARRRDLDKDDRAAMIGEIRERLATWVMAARYLQVTDFPRGLQRRDGALIGPACTSTDQQTEAVPPAWL